MAIKINFDSNNIPENPTLLLSSRSGRKYKESLYAENIIVSDKMNDRSEISFKTRKIVNGKFNKLWNKIVDFKLVWCREWDMWFEIKVEISESDKTIKTVYCTQLGYAELSQINLYNIEINTEIDIERYDYKPTVLYNPKATSYSLLHRLMEKAPHYSIAHVDNSIAKLQRTFSFDSVTIYDAFREISTEINCLFVLNSNSDKNGKIQRTISVYDLETNCLDCGHREETFDVCPKCKSKNILNGYGKDTTIFVSSEELANNIEFTTDGDSVKNCFKLEAGDDIMTSAIRNCNPNGTDYIWYNSKLMKKDMSQELLTKLDNYDTDYNYYFKEKIFNLNQNILNKYNSLIEKYKVLKKELTTIPLTITGYPALMTQYYNTIDFEGFLRHSLMPNASISDTTAVIQAGLLNSNNINVVSVENLKSISNTTADSAVLSFAKVLIDSRYKVKVNASTLSDNVWTGNFTVTNFSDDKDTATSLPISVTINDDYETFVKQKLDKALNKSHNNIYGIFDLFKLEYGAFCSELKKYSLERLTSFLDACRTCLDVLTEQGVSNNKNNFSNDNNLLYEKLYMPYYKKFGAIESEIKIREDELVIISGKYDKDGDLEISGLQNEIEKIKNSIQDALNFQKYLGDVLWLELCSYKREDKYTNDNYISDGLSNSEIFNKALEFIEIAKKDIYKSSELQHSISTDLKNLLVINKFKPLVEYFSVGNWFRVEIDDQVYKLRLISYEIDYDNIDGISVDFSDVLITEDGLSDQKDIIEQATSMATSFDSVKRQANKGNSSKKRLDEWVNKGLALTNMKIISNADNQNITIDSHGLLCREFLPLSDKYSDEQLKFFNKGLYITNDNWKTAKTGIGNFHFYNPKTGKTEEAYGVIADTLVGNLILSKDIGIYNESNSISMNEDGFVITSDSENVNKNLFTIQKKNSDGSVTKFIYVDDKGDIKINAKNIEISVGDDLMSHVDNAIISYVEEYYVSKSSTELIGGSWSNVKPVRKNGTYIWRRMLITKGNKTSSYEPDENGVCISGNDGINGADGADGKDGTDGKGIDSIENYYLATSSDNVTTSTSGWTTTIQNVSVDKKFLWTYEKITYTDKTIFKTEPCIIGTFSKDGNNGSDGIGIKKIEDFYQVTKTNTVPTIWVITPPELTPENKYLWNYEKITYTNNNIYESTKRIIGVYGDKGVAGTDGTDGKTTYFHIKYSSVSNPTSANQMTETPNTYIGTYVDFEPLDSTNPSKYTWSKFVGTDGKDGIAGINGKDGKTSYLHIAYSNSADGKLDFDISNSTGKKYIGQYVDFIQTDSVDPTKYTWTKIKGEDGKDGKDGKGIKNTKITYQASTSGTNIPTGIWQTTIPNVPQGQYLWSRTVVTYTDETSSTSYSVAYIPNNGTNGSGISSMVQQYYLSTSKLTQIGGSWITAMPQWSIGKYLWTRYQINYINPVSTSYTSPVCDSSWDAINEVQIGGRNLALNTNNMNMYIMSEGVTVSKDEEGYSVATFPKEAELKLTQLSMKNNIKYSLVKDKTVTISFEYRSDKWDAVSPDAHNYPILSLNINNTSDTSNDRDKYFTYYGNINQPTTEWQKYVFTININDSIFDSGTAPSIVKEAWFFPIIFNHSLNDMQIRKLKIEIGNKATDWSIAHEDMLVDIDNINGQLEANTNAITKLEATTSGLNIAVQKVEKSYKDSIDSINKDIQSLTQETNLSVKPEQLEIYVKKELNKGVDKVVTNTGYTFDDVGLTISKTNSELSTQITENGMKVLKNKEVVLEANNVGVSAKNLHATTYLIVGNNSRFEDIDEYRTGCFWIGGFY